MYDMSLMLHPKSHIKLIKDMPLDMGLDDTSVHIPTIDPLPSKFFNALIWGQVGQPGIDFVVEYTCHWDVSITPPLVDYTGHSCKAMAYCSSAVDVCDNVKGGIQKYYVKGISLVTLLS